jgi:hypothetical protein
MSFRTSREATGREGRKLAAVSEEQALAVGGERAVKPAAWQASADFNPLMERVMRAQQLAEGRLYGVNSYD